MFTARLAAVEFGIRIAGCRGRSRRCASETSGCKACWPWKRRRPPAVGREAVPGVHSPGVAPHRRAAPPAAGTIHSLLSGRISWPLRHWTNTIHLPSGETLGKVLLMPLFDAPAIGCGRPPRPPSNGIRQRSYWIGVSCDRWRIWRVSRFRGRRPSPRPERRRDTGHPDSSRGAMDVLRIVGTGQRLDLAGLPRVIRQNAAPGIEDLEEPEIQEVGHVNFFVQGRDGVTPIGRHLRPARPDRRAARA